MHFYGLSVLLLPLIYGLFYDYIGIHIAVTSRSCPIVHTVHKALLSLTNLTFVFNVG